MIGSLTYAIVRKLFDYNPNDGVLRWKINISKNIKVGTAAGCVDRYGYIRTKINGNIHPNHRIIYLWWYGFLPEIIDHIDTVKTNNFINNLRECTISQNGWNSNISAANTSGVKGVTWHKQANKWQAQIQVDKKSIYLGLFKNIELAELTVKNKRSEIHGEFCNHGEVKL